MITYTSAQECYPCPSQSLVLGAMSTYAWDQQLCNIPRACLVLAPPAGYRVPLVEVNLVQQQMASTTLILDNEADFLTWHIRMLQGLERIVTSPVSEEGTPKETNISRTLQNMTNLPLDMLASLARVSCDTYEEWLNGACVSDEQKSRLEELIEAFRLINKYHSSDLQTFLETDDFLGRPLDYLLKGDMAMATGLAMHVPTLSAGVPLGWDIPPLSESAFREALDHLSLEANLSHDHVLEEDDDDEEPIILGSFTWAQMLESEGEDNETFQDGIFY